MARDHFIQQSLRLSQWDSNSKKRCGNGRISTQSALFQHKALLISWPTGRVGMSQKRLRNPGLRVPGGCCASQKASNMAPGIGLNLRCGHFSGKQVLSRRLEWVSESQEFTVRAHIISYT